MAGCQPAILRSHTTIVYSIYNTVGRSISSIFDLGGIFTSAFRASVNMSPRVVYIGYGPPYRTIYITYYILYYSICIQSGSPIGVLFFTMRTRLKT